MLVFFSLSYFIFEMSFKYSYVVFLVYFHWFKDSVDKSLFGRDKTFEVVCVDGLESRLTDLFKPVVYTGDVSYMDTFFVTSDNMCHIFVYKYSFVFISNSGLHIKIIYKGKTKKSSCPIEEMNDHYSARLREMFGKMDTYSMTVLSKENHMMLFEMATE